MRQLILYRAMMGALLGALVIAGAWEQAEDEMEGEVSSLESESGTLTVTLSDGKQLALDPGTPVRKDGSIATLGDIREGDQVQASFSPSIAWLFGRKDALQDRVKQVVATSHSGGADAM